jgi:hypothetical protein
VDGDGGEQRGEAAVGEFGRLRWHGGLGLHICWYGFLLSGPVAVGDNGLNYVLCDKGCLTADKQGRGLFYNRRRRREALICGQPALTATRLPAYVLVIDPCFG